MRLLLALSLCSLSATAQQASFQGLGHLPGSGFSSRATAVSADGAVVVGSSALSETFGHREAFRWTASTGMVGLGDLPGGSFRSEATGVSANGTVIVGTSIGASGGNEAFRWTTDGEMVGLGDLPGSGFYSEALGVSADGSVVVGLGTGASGSEAFQWTVNGGMVGIDSRFNGGAFAASADGAVVVGQKATPLVTEASRWTVDDGMVGLGHLPGTGVHGRAHAVSADGTVVVGLSIVVNGIQRWEAFRWMASTGMVGLGDFPGGDYRSEAFGVSADGTVVVGSSLDADGDEAFLWTTEHGLQRLDSLLLAAGADLDGWSLQGANGISDDGTVIVGAGVNPQGQTEAWRAVLPRAASSAPTPDNAQSLTVHASPNPLRGRATLRFSMPATGPVRLSLHDVLGREVAVVADGWRAAGPHEATLDVSALPAGVYVFRLAAGTEATTRRITVAR